MWNLSDLVESSRQTLFFHEGKWIPLRPINHNHRSLPQRIKEAWAVYTGKADAVVWPGKQ